MSDITVLCYGDSNTHGTVPMTHMDDDRRFGPEERWPGVMRPALGAGHLVIEEGLPGRTTVHSDPIEGAHKNGLAYLLPCLESHRPVDVVVLMLGTNDLKARFGLPAEDIAAGAGVLVDRIRRSEAGPGRSAPRVLLVAPPPLARLELLAAMFGGGTEKALRFGGLYREVAAGFGVSFLDAGLVIESSDVDGIHFEAAQHRALGTAVAEAVRGIAAALPPV